MVQATDPDLRSSERMLAGEDIICFAGEDWWFHNPHSNLHIMQELSARNRVLFVNSPGIRMPSFQHDRYAWKRVFNKLASLLRFLRKAQPNIWVFTPIAVPLMARHQHAILRLNTWLLRFQIGGLKAWLGFRNPIVWVTVLVAKDVALQLRAKGGKCLLYYCVDNTPHYPGVDSVGMQALEDDLLRRADVALFVNHTLMQERQHLNPRTFHISHGVDYTHFAQAQQATLPVPAELQAMKGPIAGYMGEINSLDIDLLRYLAERHPEVSFVFIGDMYSDTDALAGCRNVHFLGKRPYAQLPAYLQRFDACCLYYKVHAVFNNYRNPKKLLEYLATGKPVVSVSILEVQHFRPLVAVAESYEQYSELLRDALYNDSPADRARRIDFARHHTWADVAAEASGRIRDSLAEDAGRS